MTIYLDMFSPLVKYWIKVQYPKVYLLSVGDYVQSTSKYPTTQI